MRPSKLAGMIQMGLEYAHSQLELVDRYLKQLVDRVALGKDRDPFLAFLHGYVEPPRRIVERWKDDAEFCRQLIQGLNPLVIRVVGSTCEIPKEMQGLCAQGMSLQELVSARRLFILDYRKLAFTDRTFALGTRQALQLFLSAWREFDFVKDGFKEELASRGFDEHGSDGVAGYYYRDDGYLIWNALHRYVEEAVAAVYPGHRRAADARVTADPVLQRWACECSSPDRADVPGFPRAIVSRRQLVEVLTNIVFRASAYHSAVNFPQRDYITYVPNRPDATFAEMPPGNEDITMDFILLQGLPDFFVSNFQVSFAHLLTLPSDKPLTRLGPLDEAPPFPEIHRRFQEELAGIAAKIDARNAALVRAGKQPYPYLHPDRIASSVAI